MTPIFIWNYKLCKGSIFLKVEMYSRTSSTFLQIFGQSDLTSNDLTYFSVCEKKCEVKLRSQKTHILADSVVL